MGVLMGRGMEKGVVSLSPACGRSVVVLCWHRVVVPRCCRLVLSRRRRCASSHGFAVTCWHIVVPHSCCVVVPWSPCRPPVLSSRGPEQRQMSFVVWLSVKGGWNECAMTHHRGTTNDDQCRRSSFGCHVAISDVAPGFRMVVLIR